MSSTINNTAVLIKENVPKEEEDEELVKAYKNLNDKCDLVLEKIKKRKTRQSKK